MAAARQIEIQMPPGFGNELCELYCFMRKMQSGDSFMVPNRSKMEQCYRMAKQIGSQITVQKVTGEGWRIRLVKKAPLTSKSGGGEVRTMNRSIPGCTHTAERMTHWVSEGACPICLTVHSGILRESLEELGNVLDEVASKTSDGAMERELRKARAKITVTLKTIPAPKKEGEEDDRPEK